MTNTQQQIINDISIEISSALTSCEHSRHTQEDDPDKIDAYIKRYKIRINLLRKIREQLEDDFYYFTL